MKKFLFFTLFFNIMFMIWSDDNKGTLFKSDIIGENNLYLALDGSWKFDLTTFADGNISSALTNMMFTQVPNFSASIWLFNSYFFETNITNNSDDNIFLLGYQNSDGILQEIRVGNDDLNIDSYAGYTPPINIQRSPGVRLKINSENTTHELLGRYSSEETNTVSFRGLNSKTEQSLTINNYIKGEYFIIPFADLNNITLYVKTNGELIKLDDQDFIYNSNKKLLYIHDINFDELYLLLNYSNLEQTQIDLYNFIQPSGNPGIRTEFSAEVLWDNYFNNIDGYELINLYKKGMFSPFEHLGVYDFSTDLTDTDNEFYIDNKKSINYNVNDNNIIIENPEILYDDLINRYPFMDIDLDIYKPGGTGLDSSTYVSLITLSKVNEISVPTTVKENSLIVMINGITYTNFNHNMDTGVVTFDKEISNFDNITIMYKTDVFPGIGNLLLSYGSKYNIRDDLSLELSNTGSWDFVEDDYSTEYNQHVGNLNSSLKLDYSGKYISSQLNSSLRINNPDTVGSYLLFNYDQSTLNIPLSSTILLIDEVSKPLISRYYNDLYLTKEEIQALTINPLGGAYIVKNLYENNSYKVIVLESEELIDDEYSSVVIDLDEYKGDYSWATQFSIDISNYSESRDIEIIFNNGEDDVLTIPVSLNSDSEYKKYTILLSKEDRSKLLYVDNITFKINQGPQSFILLKGIDFTGDDIITNNDSNTINILDNFYIKKNSDSMEILSSETADCTNIILSSRISPIELKHYGLLKFSITNNGLLNSDSTITMDFKTNTNILTTLTIPKNIIVNGINNFKVDLDSDKVYVNGTYIKDVIWNNQIDELCNMISVTISQYEKSSSFILSNIILEEPKLDLYNENSLFMNIKPKLKLTISNKTIFENLDITLINYLSSNNDNNNDFLYSGEVDVSFNIIGVGIKTGTKYNGTFSEFDYKISLPHFQSPLTVTDTYYYNTNSHRSSGLNISTTPFNLKLLLSDTTGQNKGLKESGLEIELDKGLFIINNSLSLSQNRDDTIDNLEYEVLNSYYKLIPINDLFISNMIKNNLTIDIITPNIFLKSSFNFELNQGYSPQREDFNKYNIDISTGLSIGKLSISTGLTSTYNYKLNSNIFLLDKGIQQYFALFKDTNPYGTVEPISLFFTNNNSNFYYDKYSQSSRDLDSTLSLTIGNDYTINNNINTIIPKTLTYSINKSFSNEQSQETTLLNNSLNIDFTHSNIIKNSFILLDSLNIEKNSNTFTLQWKLIYYKEIVSDLFLDITNDISLSENNLKNVSNLKIIWPGKSGPLLIIPIVNKVFDSPYNYIHKESLYFNMEDDENKIGVGIRHETVLSVKDINETNFYIEIGYKTYSSDRLSFEMGLLTTLIF